MQTAGETGADDPQKAGVVLGKLTFSGSHACFNAAWLRILLQKLFYSNPEIFAQGLASLYVLVFHVQVSLFGPRAEWQYLGHITETVMQSVLLQECEDSASAASGIGARNWTLVMVALAKPCILLLLLDSKTIADSTELTHKSMCRIAGFWVQGFLPAVQPIQSGSYCQNAY